MGLVFGILLNVNAVYYEGSKVYFLEYGSLAFGYTGADVVFEREGHTIDFSSPAGGITEFNLFGVGEGYMCLYGYLNSTTIIRVRGYDSLGAGTDYTLTKQQIAGDYWRWCGEFNTSQYKFGLYNSHLAEVGQIWNTDDSYVKIVKFDYKYMGAYDGIIDEHEAYSFDFGGTDDVMSLWASEQTVEGIGDYEYTAHSEQNTYKLTTNYSMCSGGLYGMNYIKCRVTVWNETGYFLDTRICDFWVNYSFPEHTVIKTPATDFITLSSVESQVFEIIFTGAEFPYYRWTLENLNTGDKYVELRSSLLNDTNQFQILAGTLSGGSYSLQAEIVSYCNTTISQATWYITCSESCNNTYNWYYYIVGNDTKIPLYNSTIQIKRAGLTVDLRYLDATTNQFNKTMKCNTEYLFNVINTDIPLVYLKKHTTGTSSGIYDMFLPIYAKQNYTIDVLLKKPNGSAWDGQPISLLRGTSLNNQEIDLKYTNASGMVRFIVYDAEDMTYGVSFLKVGYQFIQKFFLLPPNNPVTLQAKVVVPTYTLTYIFNLSEGSMGYHILDSLRCTLTGAGLNQTRSIIAPSYECIFGLLPAYSNYSAEFRFPPYDKVNEVDFIDNLTEDTTRTIVMHLPVFATYLDGKVIKYKNTGEVYPDVRVQIQGLPQDLTTHDIIKTTVTDSKGEFHFINLPIGSYSISAYFPNKVDNLQRRLDNTDDTSNYITFYWLDADYQTPETEIESDEDFWVFIGGFVWELLGFIVFLVFIITIMRLVENI